MECQIKNSLVVGAITSVTGTIIMIIVNPEKKINIKRHLIIFFIVGIIVHILLEYFNFNSFCYDKKCYGDLCRGEYCKI
tara:strand:- start:1021 stop:1257 length:237 start_codon:yes stop_codon:yes gene_type:complete